MHRVFTGPLRVEHITIAVADLPDSLEGTKLVHLSDFHYDGLRLSESLLAQAIVQSNAAKPDLVLLTGDYVTTEPDPIYNLVLRLQRLESRCGIYAVLGNHDLKYRHSKIEIIQAMTHGGIQVLWNEVAYPFGSQLALVGLADLWSGDFHPETVLASLETSIPRIVLSHNPDTAQLLQTWRVDLQLSGHTHGGQVVLPKIGPVAAYLKSVRRLIPIPLRPWIPYMSGKCHKVVENWEWASGFHQVGHNQLYVNRGLGTYFPGRLFCPPEVTVIKIVAAQKSKSFQSC
jgi:predicted MPP superfamily phosphohydrolase